MAQLSTREDALEQRLSELPGLWLEIRCACGVTTFYPCALLAKQCDAQVRTRDVLGRFRCRKCRRRPASVALTDDPTGGAPGLVGERRMPWRLDLVP